MERKENTMMHKCHTITLNEFHCDLQKFAVNSVASCDKNAGGNFAIALYLKGNKLCLPAVQLQLLRNQLI